ncbi:MAG: hypothetical protein F4Y45_12000 [Acidobacteria bacterium]|nr:hypothetical protein [Acidobacteriota bacterium]MXZ72397.1 hypothetical protein [Acidobacteriota bacterium]MYD72035.1 hypothetical protein [Acidobacteriota bacterium]MYJ03082.1 hypothetical protein [Acidobacteriota bacterium]
MLKLLRRTVTLVAALLVGFLGLVAVLLLAPPGQELRAQISRLVSEQAPAVIRNLTGAFGAVRNLVDPAD